MTIDITTIITNIIQNMNNALNEKLEFSKNVTKVISKMTKSNYVSLQGVTDQASLNQFLIDNPQFAD